MMGANERQMAGPKSGTARRRSRWSVVVTALALLAAACGGGGDDTATGGDEATVTGDSAAAETDDTGGSDSGDTTSEGSADSDGGSADGSDGGSAEPALPEGTGTLVADLCNGGQFINGAITIDDLVGWGVLASSDVTINGGDVFNPVAYNDFGSICNIDSADGGESMSITMSNNVGDYDLVAEQSPVLLGEEGGWKWALSDGFATLTMEHTDADGIKDTFGILWWPEDDDRKNPDEVQRVFVPLIEAIVDRTTVDIERLAPPATPAWYACDDANGGVLGLDPATLLATVGNPAERGVTVSQDVGGFFGFTECRIETEVGLDRVSVQVQDPSQPLQDTVESFLAGWPEAEARTVAGYEVAFLDARAFTVIDDTPVEVSILVTNADIEADFEAAVELVLSSIG